MEHMGSPPKTTQDEIWKKEKRSPYIKWNNSLLGKNSTVEP